MSSDALIALPYPSFVSRTTAYSAQVNGNFSEVATKFNQHVDRTVSNVMDYGCKGDGTTDDTADFQAGLTAVGLAGGGILFVPNGTYKLTATLTISSGTRIVMDSDATLSSSASPILEALGTLGTSVPLTSNTTVNGTSLAFAAGSESNFAVDDFVLAGSSAYYEDRTEIYGAGTGQKIGEIAQVASTSSGAAALRAPLAGGFKNDSGTDTLVYKTTDSAFVRKITQVANIEIEGGTIVGTSGSGSGSQVGVHIQYGRRIRIRNVLLQHIAATGVSLESCVDGIIQGCSFFDMWSTGTGYAVAVGDASQDCEVVSCFMRNSRHAFTTTSSAGSFGITRRIAVRGCKVFGTVNTGDALDTHAGAENISFLGNQVHGAAGHGINIECSSATVEGNTVIGCQSSGIAITNYTFARPRYRVLGNRFRVCGLNAGSWSSIRLKGPGSASSGLLNGSIVIVGNECVDANNVGIDIEGSASFSFSGIVVKGNTIENPGSAAGAIFLDYSDRTVVSGNVIRRLSANYDAIRVGNSNKCVVIGNVMDWPTIGAGLGVHCVSAVDAAIIGNTATNGGTGLSLDNSSTNCLIVANNIRGCTTPLSRGTGAGHVVGLSGSTDLEIIDGKDLLIGASTGSKIGQSGSKIALFGATPVVKPSAYTQTYSTADKTLATPTSATVTDAFGTADGTIADVGAAFSQTTLNNNFQDLTTAYNQLRADHLDLAQFVNAVVDDLQALGLVG